MAAHRTKRDNWHQNGSDTQAVSPGKLGDARRVRTSAPQCPVHEQHTAEAAVTFRAHPQMRLAALAQHPMRGAERHDNFRDAGKRFSVEQILESSKGVSMPTSGLGLLVNRFYRQAFDQGMDQLVLQPMRRLMIGERTRAHFGRTDGGSVKVAQLPQSRTRRSPSCDGRHNEFGSCQGAPILGKVVAG